MYLDQQSIDTTTSAGKLMFQITGAFAEFERSMIRTRVNAGLKRAKDQIRQKGHFVTKHGEVKKRLGRPGADPEKLRKGTSRACRGNRQTLGKGRYASKLNAAKVYSKFKPAALSARRERPRLPHQAAHVLGHDSAYPIAAGYRLELRAGVLSLSQAWKFSPPARVRAPQDNLASGRPWSVPSYPGTYNHEEADEVDLT
jgi:hypothetical protein